MTYLFPGGREGLPQGFGAFSESEDGASGKVVTKIFWTIHNTEKK